MPFTHELLPNCLAPGNRRLAYLAPALPLPRFQTTNRRTVNVFAARRFAVVLVAIALSSCSDDKSAAMGERLRAALPKKEDSSAGTLDLGGST